MIPKPLANVIVVIVTVVWAGNFFASVFLPDYRGDPILNLVFMAIVGSAIALKQGDGGSTMLRVIAAWRGVPLPPSESDKRPEEGQNE